jgi:hypothetical protein
VKKSSRILPRVWLILFGVWKPIKRENSEFSLACSRNTAQKHRFLSRFSGFSIFFSIFNNEFVVVLVEREEEATPGG